MREHLRVALKGALRPPENDSAFLLDPHRRGVPGRERMRRFGHEQAIDMLIVGAGAGGATLAQRLARRGWKVLILEAGPFWDPDDDWVSDEAGAHPLYWTEERIIGGEDPVELGKNNSGRGVGGSMIHYAGYTPRFHPCDFEVRTRDGVAADWPISYQDLRPHYERLERELPVAGEFWPWGDPHGYPHGPHPMALARSAHGTAPSVWGSRCASGLSGSPTGRSGIGRTASTAAFACRAARWVPRPPRSSPIFPMPLSTGSRYAPTAWSRGSRPIRRAAARGVIYFHDGQERFRPLTLSPLPGIRLRHRDCYCNPQAPGPNGLANNNDLVGRRIMVQGAPQVAGRFPDEMRMYKAPPPKISSEQFYETSAARGFARGFSIQTVGPLPIGWAEHVHADGHWGQALREYMRDYNHWATIGALCELLPSARNRVTLADQTDRNGMPVARLDYTQCDNDRANIAYTSRSSTRSCKPPTPRTSSRSTATRISSAAERWPTARTSESSTATPRLGVPNLFVCDGSVMPTQGSANPALRSWLWPAGWPSASATNASPQSARRSPRSPEAFVHKGGDQ